MNTPAQAAYSNRQKPRRATFFCPVIPSAPLLSLIPIYSFPGIRYMLFNSLKLGALTLPNRILLAPLTRTRADAGHMPNALMAEYYAQRASAGLLITECTMVLPNTSAFINEPSFVSFSN